MSERKVLQKYYPPDFDPSSLTRKRGPKQTGPKVQTVRIMAPFSMKCTTCGEYIYKGRKFNSRKETNQAEKYLNIQIHRFHIKCTRCSAEIIFRTDPKIADYAVVKGALRNMEPWRNKEGEKESVDERLDRLEREDAEAAGEEEKNAMADLEAKNEDARREMAAADALDEIRQRNARIQRSEKDGVDFSEYVVRPEDEERARLEREDEEAAKRAFAAARERASLMDLGEEIIDDDDAEGGVNNDLVASSSSSSSAVAATSGSGDKPETAEARAVRDTSMMPPPPPPVKRVVKKKKDYSAALGIKKKPSLV
ncbi:cell cycle control protein cwf16 [Colletotrichum tofieldiae]|uniref:Splicing factor YJU2 n=1 Tax=Colletotrichum tofieldiae TaxID=708197 RepID=A0A166RKK4_9PEZI|nr:cell cycle control protein cwf16 [Colletotrichum tofieldiae]GKT58710.1 cell cycle control protein cwf16 [Colletotrichum tofieldiae]GKT77867.1 cell cycle control protein cwf16 [Colletotrichum tofieldiae]GKT84825.1 cell cycle control protein cwf16 [Colletotrichum tofieldiae]